MVEKVIEALEIQLERQIEIIEDPEQTTEARLEAMDQSLVLLNHISDLRLKKAQGRNKILQYIANNPALLAVLGNLMGIVLILQYEKMDSITSRAFSLIKPNR